MPDINDDAIRETILELTRACAPGKTICPSEAAQKLDPENWRGLLKSVRRVAQKSAHAGDIAIYRKGKPIDPDAMKGVIRLGLPRA